MMQERELCSPEIINRSLKKTSGHNRRFYVLLAMLNYNLYDIFKKTSSAIINNYIFDIYQSICYNSKCCITACGCGGIGRHARFRF